MIQKLAIVLLALATAATGSVRAASGESATMLDIGGVVQPTSFADKYFVQAASPNRFRFVADPVDPSRTVLEVALLGTDLGVAGGRRSEIIAKGDMLKSGVRWYGFEFYIPPDWKITPKGIVVSQIHGNDNLNLIPLVSLGITGTKMYLMLGSNSNRIDSSTPPRSENTTRISPWEQTLIAGRWYRLVVRANWSFEPGKGAIDIWIDDRFVFSAHDIPNSYDTSGGGYAGNYAKMGLYAWDGLGSIDQQRILVRGIVLGQPTAKYRDVVDALSAR